MEISKLNSYPLHKFLELFTSSQIPERTSIRGKYRAAFVGPGWLRTAAGPALALSGLGGWWGKEFREDGTAINIVMRAGKFSMRFPMRFVNARSLIDGRDGLALHYQPGNPFPWPFVVDEIRQLDASTLLGMTMADVRGLRSLAFPFILQHQP